MASLFLLAIAFLQIAGSNCLKSLPEENLDTPDLIKYWDYPVEEHEVETEDGYILKMHRIPGGRNNTGDEEEDKARQPIFLQHTILSSSADWVINYPNTSLAFVLADKGYDVWLGNLRGNIYSKKHKKLQEKDEKFWDFSLDEHAKYDFPAKIDYILKNTSQSQLYFIGHSYGCMVALAAVSENKHLMQKIKVFFALAPITRMEHMTTLTRTMAGLQSKMAWIFKWFHVHQFLPPLKWSRKFITTMCRWIPIMCRFGISIIGGRNNKFLDKKRLPVYVAHTPAGTSVKAFYHSLQLINSKRFQKYDYGSAENMKHYKAKIAPEYDIKQMKIPTVVVSGTNDNMAPPRDMAWTLKTLPFVIKHFRIEDYSHMDFVWGKNSGSMLYEKLSYYMSN